MNVPSKLRILTRNKETHLIMLTGIGQMMLCSTYNSRKTLQQRNCSDLETEKHRTRRVSISSYRRNQKVNRRNSNKQSKNNVVSTNSKNIPFSSANKNNKMTNNKNKTIFYSHKINIKTATHVVSLGCKHLRSASYRPMHLQR